MSKILNDAEPYGVKIIPAMVEAGEDYWQVIRVHHLTPTENRGLHHIFINAVNANNERIPKQQILVTWDGGSDILLTDTDKPEAGANFPMWKWQICSVEALGARSDKVVNLRTDHPDEAPGNSMFHHSFAITFRYTQATAATTPAASSLSGRIPGGSGHSLVLLGAAGELASQVVPADEYYHFENLAAGRYLVQDRNDHRVLGPITLDGQHSVAMDFARTPPSGRLVTDYLLLEDAANPETQLYLSLLADFLSARGMPFGFDVNAAALAQQVYVIGAISSEARETLEAAQCQITTLPATPSELLAAL